MLTPDLGNIQLGGELGRRLEMAMRRLLREEEYPLREGFTARPYTLNYLLADLLWLSDEGSPCGHWAGDESGRYINVLSCLAPYAGNIYPNELKQELRQRLKKAVDGILPLQRDEGYFGKKLDENKLHRDHISGHNWLLRGLVEYYKITRDEKVLLAARKLGDYYIKIHPRWTTPEAMIDAEPEKYAYVYSNYTHCLDGLVNLWRVTKEEKYLNLARKIGKLVKTFEHAVHSHHFFSTLRGLINLYLSSNDKFYLDKVEREWEAISAKGILPTYGVPECYTGWASDEGCSEVDWAMINLYLWNITQKPRYINMAEKVIFNHFFWNQCSNGGFSCNYGGGGDFRLGKMGNHTPGKRTEAYWCCSMHCTFGLAEIARHIFTYNQNNLWVNLFNNVKSAFRMGDSDVRVEIETLYPMKGFVRVGIESKNLFELKIRIPEWAEQETLSLLVNEKPLKPDLKDGYVCIPKKGKRLKVKLNFPLPLRIEGAGEKQGIFYGPSILRPIDKVDDSEIIIVPVQPDYRVENGLLQLTLFGVKSSEDIDKKDKWIPRFFEPISQEPFRPLDLTTFLFRISESR